jgi:type IV pilus assembly protein PilO
MALLPTKQRDQVMVLVTVVAISLVGLFWNFVYDPRSADLDRIEAHVDSLDKANHKAKSELATGTVEQIREEARTSRENLDLMRTLVPAANEVSSLIDQVSTAARRAHLDIGALEPEPVIEGELFDTYRYRMKMNGSYHDLGQMLANVGSLNRIVSSINLQLTASQGGHPSPPGKQMLASSFEIQTYVVRTAPRPKPVVKKPAAAESPAPPAPATPAKKPAGGGA